MKKNLDDFASLFAKKETPKIEYELNFWGHMAAGAVSRTIAQSLLHPADVVKTVLQTQKITGEKVAWTLPVLMRGMDVQLCFSLPHGAFSYAITEFVKGFMDKHVPYKRAGFALDFLSSAASTLLCSIVSTPQMVLHDRCMAGIYPSLGAGVREVLRTQGPAGFYSGWVPSIVEKIPSYGLTWMFFKQLQEAWTRVVGRRPDNRDNFLIGALAAGGSVTVMMPMDIVKTRLVTQIKGSPGAYAGIADCFRRVAAEEGLRTFYAGLRPRLVSVVPMIGLQFGIYEVMKNAIGRHQSALKEKEKRAALRGMCREGDEECLRMMEQELEAAIDVALDPSS